MKNYYLRSCVALACALSMTACGGSNNDVTLYVSVYGVTMDGLTLTNNDGPPLPVPKGSSMVSFPALVGADSNFEIKIATEVPNAKCVLNNAKGKTGTYSPNNISLVCTVYTYNLGGTITGLNSGGLILVNGSDRKTIPSGSTSFNMTIPAVAAVPATATAAAIAAQPETGKVAEGSPYGVLIYQQPTGGTCQITGGTGVGIMPRGDVSSITITCP